MTVSANGVNPESAASQLRWKIERDPSDTVASGLPGLSATTGVEITVTPSTAGNFRLICFFDSNGNNAYNAGEELRVLRFAVVRATLETSTDFSAIDSGGLSYVGAAQPGGEFSVNSQSDPGLMLIICRVLLEGGGSNRAIGIAKIPLGNVGNLISDTSKVNYGTSGSGSETPSQQLPMIDSVSTPAGGDTVFRSFSSFQVNAGPGGNGKNVDVTSDDDPDIGPFKVVHPTTSVTWTSTQGGYDFREYIVGFSTSFPKSYVVFAKADYSVRVNGNNSGSTWVNNGSTLTIQGVNQGATPTSQALTNLVSGGSPQSGDAAGIQVLGLTYADLVNRPFVYTTP